MSRLGQRYKKFGTVTPEIDEEIRVFYRNTKCSLSELSLRFSISPSKLSMLYGVRLGKLKEKPQIVFNHPSELNTEEIFLTERNPDFFEGLCKGFYYPSEYRSKKRITAQSFLEDVA